MLYAVIAIGTAFYVSKIFFMRNLALLKAFLREENFSLKK